MRLSEFILQRLEAILVEWESFARSLLQATRGMSPELLRDHAKQMLETIAADMATEQSPTEQKVKSEGGRERSSPYEDTPSEIHAIDRHESGFTLNELVAEYRALRASVIRLWTREVGETDRLHLDELTRFNEALDEALTEAVQRFTAGVERDRDLLLGALGHDLRNPLSAVLHSAQFLMRSALPTDSHAKAVARIVNSGGRMHEMISDLLDLAQTRLGTQDRSLSTHDTFAGHRRPSWRLGRCTNWPIAVQSHRQCDQAWLAGQTGSGVRLLA